MDDEHHTLAFVKIISIDSSCHILNHKYILKLLPKAVGMLSCATYNWLPSWHKYQKLMPSVGSRANCNANFIAI